MSDFYFIIHLQFLYSFMLTDAPSVVSLFGILVNTRLVPL